MKTPTTAEITTTPGNIFENIQNSPIAIHGEISNYNIPDKSQTDMLLKLMDSIIKLNERLVALQEKK